MPKFNANIREAEDFKITPGIWLVKVPKVAKLGETSKPGIEIGATAKKHEMWKCIVEVIDKSKDAPTGVHFYENLVWDGEKGESRIIALLRHLGHPVDEWKKNPGNVDITPDMIYERPFVMRTKTRYYERQDKDKSWKWGKALEADGFQPFASVTGADGKPTPTGAVPDTTPVPTTPPTGKGNKGGGGGGDTGFNFGANAQGGGSAPASKDEFGWS